MYFLFILSAQHSLLCRFRMPMRRWSAAYGSRSAVQKRIRRCRLPVLNSWSLGNPLQELGQALPLEQGCQPPPVLLVCAIFPSPAWSNLSGYSHAVQYLASFSQFLLNIKHVRFPWAIIVKYQNSFSLLETFCNSFRHYLCWQPVVQISMYPLYEFRARQYNSILETVIPGFVVTWLVPTWVQTPNTSCSS